MHDVNLSGKHHKTVENKQIEHYVGVFFLNTQNIVNDNTDRFTSNCHSRLHFGWNKYKLNVKQQRRKFWENSPSIKIKS